MADQKSGMGGGAGLFTLGRNCEVDARLGRLHESRSVSTGVPALTLTPRDDVEWQPGGACRMSLVYEPEQESVTVAVEQVPTSMRTSELTNLLVLMSAAFRRVEHDVEVDAHLSSGPVRCPATEDASGRWGSRPRSWFAAAGAVVLMASIAWFCLPPAPKLLTPADFNSVAGKGPQRKMDFVDRSGSSPVVAYPLPSKPVPKQAVPPCVADNAEVEINKGCWVELAKKPPCGPSQAEYQNKCYLPVRKEDPLPQSVKP